MHTNQTLRASLLYLMCMPGKLRMWEREFFKLNDGCGVEDFTFILMQAFLEYGVRKKTSKVLLLSKNFIC